MKRALAIPARVIDAVIRSTIFTLTVVSRNMNNVIMSWIPRKISVKIEKPNHIIEKK
jgi:hypothetical protein